MGMITLRQLMDFAAENDFGMPAFNVNNLEQVQAIMEAAHEVDAPVILQASSGARKYAGDIFLSHLIKAASTTYPEIPIVMHQDHGNEPQVCLSAIMNGFTSVMMDGSLKADMKTPSDFDYNVAVTKEVCDLAHSVGVSVEGEIGCLGSLETCMMGEEDGHGSDDVLSHDQLLTDPDEAAAFVAATGVDALAVAVGTSHGAYKFINKPSSDVLQIDRIQAIHQKIPNTHLVMHGSSSVLQELLARVNNYGGDLGQTYGVPVQAIVEGIKHGVRKINIDTDLRLAFTAAIREFFVNNPKEFDPRKYLIQARASMKEVCKSRFEVFGAAGFASKIKAKSLTSMLALYE